MHIAYSALNNPGKQPSTETAARFRGYLAARDKHAATIAAIKRYLPDWEPKPPGPLKREARLTFA